MNSSTSKMGGWIHLLIIAIFYLFREGIAHKSLCYLVVFLYVYVLETFVLKVQNEIYLLFLEPVYKEGG